MLCHCFTNFEMCAVIHQTSMASAVQHCINSSASEGFGINFITPHIALYCFADRLIQRHSRLGWIQGITEMLSIQKFVRLLKA